MPKFKNREEYEQWKAESMRDLGAERKTPEDQDGQMIALDKCPDVVAEDSPPPLNITASNTQQGHTMQQTASPPRDGLICVNCGQLGRVKSYTRGSLGVELLLWIFFLVPGLIYSVWRQSTQAKVCRACGSPNVIPTSTPRGEQLWQELHSYRENWLRGEEKVSDTNGIKLRDNPLYFNILHFTPWRFPSITVVSPHVAMRRSHIHDAITVQTLFLLNPSTALLIYRLRLNLMAFFSDPIFYR